MAQFHSIEREYMSQVSVGDHFDTPNQAEGQSAKRRRLFRSSTSENENNDSTAWYKNIKVVDVRSIAEKRKTPTRSEDKGCGYRMSPNPAETVRASFHQNSSGQGLSEFRGSQCTTIALSAIMVSTTLPVQTWTSRDMDAILRYGDRSHRKLMTDPDRNSVDGKLALHEIPVGEMAVYLMPVPSHDTDWSNGRFSPARQAVTVNKSEEYYGPVRSTKRAYAMQMELHDTPMEDALSRIMNGDYTGALVTVENVTGAVMRDNDGRIRFFDSHANNKIGRVNPEGTAVLLTFDTVRDLVRHIRRKTDNPQSRYEMIGIKAEVLKKIAVCRPIRRSS